MYHDEFMVPAQAGVYATITHAIFLSDMHCIFTEKDETHILISQPAKLEASPQAEF